MHACDVWVSTNYVYIYLFYACVCACGLCAPLRHGRICLCQPTYAWWACLSGVYVLQAPVGRLLRFALQHVRATGAQPGSSRSETRRRPLVLRQMAVPQTTSVFGYVDTQGSIHLSCLPAGKQPKTSVIMLRVVTIVVHCIVLLCLDVIIPY
jgi:hypothetical protein